MRFFLQLKLTVRSLLNRKLRMFLSVLGISIGIASVIILMSLGEGNKRDVEQQLKEFGSDLIVISAGKQEQKIPGRGDNFASVETLSLADVNLVNLQSQNIIESAPIYSQDLHIKYLTNSLTTSVIGTTSAYQQIRNHYVSLGEMFNEQDTIELHRVAVLGYGPYKELFGDDNPLGKTIRINNINFTVIGVLEEKGVDLSGSDMDDQILIPVSTALERVYNVTYLQMIYAQAVPNQMEAAKQDITSILTESHGISPDKSADFIIQDQTDLVSSQKGINESYQWLLGGIAVITLLIGGIGIMALMLVNIKERMKEIGLRRAIGAIKKDILLQFIFEAIFLGFIGGIFGIMLGLLSVYIISSMLGWTIYISWTYIILAQGVSLLFGLVFGVYPAYKAADLDPIVALRSQ